MGNVALGITSTASMMEVDVSSVASDTFTTLGSHGLAAGDYVILSGELSRIGATSANGKRFGYVISSGLGATTFKLSATYGGEANTYTTVDPARVWVKPSILRKGTNLQVTINEALDDSETSIDLTAGHGARLPSAPFVLLIEGPKDATPTERWERVLVTTKSTDTLTVTRGYEGTTATAHSTGRTAWVRSLAPSANCIAQLDWREATIRDEIATGLLAAGKDPSTDDSTEVVKGFIARTNTLFAVTGTGTTLTVTGTHGLILGDRFCFMAKVGGSNVRMGHTYYVTGTSGGLQFAEEKHGSTYTTDITLASDITSGTIRVFTRSGTQVFDYRTSLYPKMWGLMYDWVGGDEFARGSFDCTPLSTREYLDPLTLRGTQAFLHMLSVADGWEDKDNKLMSQSLTFHKDTSGGTFTLTANGSTTAAITFSTTMSTLRSRITTALTAIGLTNVRVSGNNLWNGTTLVQYGVQIVYSNSRNGITAFDRTSLTGSTSGSITGPIGLVKSTDAVLATFTPRLAKLGEQIAAMANDKLGTKPNVLIRMDYEFNKLDMWWVAFPSNTSTATDAQVLAYHAIGSTGGWKKKWNAMSAAVKTTGGATNAKTVWCPLNSNIASSYKAAYSTGAQAPDFVGFDLYAKPGDPWVDPTVLKAEIEKRIAGLAIAAPGKSVIVGEFGHHTSGDISDPIPTDDAADPQGNSTLITNSSALLLSGGDNEPTLTSGTIGNRDPWFKAFMEKLYSKSNVVAALYYDIDMKAHGYGKRSRWSLDGSPTLVDQFAIQTRIPKNRRQV